MPDLASLTLTPASSSPASSPHPAHRRPRASSPIPIPTSANPPPQTFRPQNNLPSAARIDRMKDGRSRYKSSLSAFNSTRSFQSAAIPDSPPRSDVPLRQEFVPEVVHSTIPLALLKAEGDTHEPEPVKYKITWRGHGKKVYLIRAGHDNWQGRQAMEYECATSCSISLCIAHHAIVQFAKWNVLDDCPSLAGHASLQVYSGRSDSSDERLSACSR